MKQLTVTFIKLNEKEFCYLYVTILKYSEVILFRMIKMSKRLFILHLTQKI